ncbi:hypothetical protein C0Q70_05623 [Pomacea canaliculata]|uniref:Amidohydrolase-related domain-containing protein n=1 Tax=Pomacea canaliculata TaxID=400727 RepID=A0A2T7PLT4_POMCA|nr:hypothetical protein C0Q70_05623 [Pomacea canaliculata]
MEVAHGSPLQESGSQSLSTSRFSYTKLRQPLLLNSWQHRTQQEKRELSQRLKVEVERLSEYNERLKRLKALPKKTVPEIETKRDRRPRDETHEQTILQEGKRGKQWPFPDHQVSTEALSLFYRDALEKSGELVPVATGVVKTPFHADARLSVLASTIVSRKKWGKLGGQMTEEEAETPTRRTEKEKRSYSIFMKALRTAHSIASQEVRRKWKNLITMVRMVNGFLWEFTRRSRIKDPILSPFLDFETQESRRRMDIALMKPKAVTEVSPNSNAVLMLCKPHYARTEDEIETVLTNLRYLKGFCSFTEDIQVKLAKYGRHMETDTRFVEKRPNRYQLYQRLSARNLHATNLAAISCLYLSSGLRTNLKDSESSVNSPHMVAKMQEWPLEFLPKKGSHKKKRWHLRATNDDDASIETVANEQVSQHSDLVSSFLLNDVSSQSDLTDTSNNHIKQGDQTPLYATVFDEKPKTSNRSSCGKTASSWQRRKAFRVPPEYIPRKATKVRGSQQRHKYSTTGPPAYIKMETLHPGDVFGLDQLVEPGWENRRVSGSVALVSMGADVILLNKVFYTSMSNVSSFGEVQRTMHIYPSHETMQERYKLYIAWSLYTDKICDEFYEKLRNTGAFGVDFSDIDGDIPAGVNLVAKGLLEAWCNLFLSHCGHITVRSVQNRIVLVTDAMRAMGLPEGIYNFGQQKVEICGKRALLKDTETLAGSIARMDTCVRHFAKSARCGPVLALEAASLHPAQLLGITKSKGTLDYGSDADFIFLNDNLEVKATYIAGECVWTPDGVQKYDLL